MLYFVVSFLYFVVNSLICCELLGLPYVTLVEGSPLSVTSPRPHLFLFFLFFLCFYICSFSGILFSVCFVFCFFVVYVDFLIILTL